jgi:uncharacterized glyoxalase superfamily protein PhnB
VQRAVPMLAYEDVAGAVEWLGRAFGFVERERYAEDDGRVTQSVVELDGAVVMLGWPGPDYQSPHHHALECATAARWSRAPYIIDGALIYVDDVDAAFERARAAGAIILSRPETQPHGRLFRAADPEGHRWMLFEAPSGA